MPIILPRSDFNLLRKDSACSASEIDSSVSKSTSSQALPVQGLAPPARRVVFNTDVYVQETIHINDYTDSEFDATWHTRQDLKDQKAEFAVTVRMIVDGRYFGDDEFHCARGLEFRHREGAKERQSNKLKGLMSVLVEQERQQIVGEENDEKIAQVFINANFHCRHAAHQMGLHDEEAVFGPLRDDFSLKSRSSSVCSERNNSKDIPASSKNGDKSGLRRFFGRIKK